MNQDFGDEDEDLVIDQDDLDMFNESNLVELKRSRLVSVDQFAFDEDAAEDNRLFMSTSQQPPQLPQYHESLFPYQPIPQQDKDSMRAEYTVVTAVANYNLLSLFTLQYARVTQGTKVPPVVFDANTQRLVEQEIKFDF